MKTQESRGVARSDRDREAAFQERQARRQAVHRGEHVPPRHRPAPPRAQPQAPDVDRPGRAAPRRSLMLIPFLILISLAAAAIAAYALSREPSTSALQSRIGTLDRQLSRAQHQLAALHAQIAASATDRTVTQVHRSVAGLKRTVGGVQNAIVPLRAELNSLRICLPQLQAEVTGVAAHAHQHGVTTVGLSAECSTFFGG